MAGYCSLVILCIGAAAALSAMALVAIAAFTDHWVEVETNHQSPDEYLCPGACGPGGGEGGGQGRRAGDRLLLQAQGAVQGLLSWH